MSAPIPQIKCCTCGITVYIGHSTHVEKLVSKVTLFYMSVLFDQSRRGDCIRRFMFYTQRKAAVFIISVATIIIVLVFHSLKPAALYHSPGDHYTAVVLCHQTWRLILHPFPSLARSTSTLVLPRPPLPGSRMTAGGWVCPLEPLDTAYCARATH